MDKKSKLEYGDSIMTHAMLLTAVDMKGNDSIKWRIENSWGEKGGDKGYMLMTDKWFDEYTYEVVVDKKYLPSPPCCQHLAKTSLLKTQYQGLRPQ